MDLKGRALKQSRSARSTNSAARSSKSIGRQSPVTETFDKYEERKSGQLTLSAEVFPAKTYPGQVEVRGFMGNSPAFGVSSPVLLAKFDHNMQSWKTQQLCLVEGLATYSETWPSSGTTQNGIAYQLPTLELPIRENAYGWWPTPRAADKDNCGGSAARLKARKHGTYIGRDMNPQVSEWLLGFPIGWTELPHSEMPYSRRSRKS